MSKRIAKACFILQISYEFSLQYPGILHDAFETSWQIFSQRVVDILKTHYKKSIIKDWSNEIIELLALYKMLPAKVTPNNMTTVEEFAKAVDKLIVFREVRMQYFFIYNMLYFCKLDTFQF